MVVAHLRHLGSRQVVWLGTFSVVIFSLIVWAGTGQTLTRDGQQTPNRWWPDILPSTNNPALDAITRVPDPQTEAHAQVWGNYKWYSDSKLRALAACVARGDCHKNAHKVLIINVWHCHNAFFSDYWGGEGTWCNAMRRSLEKQGYTVLYTYYDLEYVEHIYRQIPDLVVAIFLDDDHLGTKIKQYYKTKDRPHGIPAWKFFRFSYYAADSSTLVGDAWSVTCEPEWHQPDYNFRNFTYLGYAMEPDLAHTTFILHADRPHRAYVLGKHQTFFYTTHGARVAWPLDFYARARTHMRVRYPDFEFVGSFKDERGAGDIEKEGPMPLPSGIRNLPHLNATAFDHELSQARILVGIGYPTASPSPYRALARGVPFLSPFAVRHDGTASDPHTWSDSQHDSLRFEKPPLVYNVQEGDYDGFIAALEAAMVTPIDPFVYPRMTTAEFDARMRTFMDTDWRAEAARILTLRIKGEESQRTPFVEVFEL